jgi:hypothetical protein
VARKKWEYASLEWLHRVREEAYRRTKRLPLEVWLRPADPEKARQACRRLGLRVRVAPAQKKKTA